MSSKISALPDPGPPDHSCYLTYIDGMPDNFKCTIEELLTAPPTDSRRLANSSGTELSLISSTNEALLTLNGGSFEIQNGAPVALLIVDNTGNVKWELNTLKTYQIIAYTNSITLGAGGVNIFCGLGMTVNITFSATNPTDWSGPGVPAMMNDAINRIAAALVSRTGLVPIP